MKPCHSKKLLRAAVCRRPWFSVCCTPSRNAEWWISWARTSTSLACVPGRQRLYRLGYAAQGTDYQFSKEVSEGLQRAAVAEGIELICVDNRYSAKIAQRSADLLVREKVDLAIEFQTDEEVAPIVAAKYREANIPMIAIDIPILAQPIMVRTITRRG